MTPLSSYPRTVLWLAAATFVACGLLAARLRLDHDLFAVAPVDEPSIVELERTAARFGTLDRLLLVVERRRQTTPRATVEEAVRTLSAWRDRVVSLPEVLRAGDLQEDLETAAEELLPWALLLVPAERQAELEERLSVAGLADAARLSRHRLMGPAASLEKAWLRRDPWGLLRLTRLPEEVLRWRERLEGGFLADGDRSLLVAVIQPTFPARDVRRARRLVDAVREMGEELGPSVALRLGMAGGHALAAVDSAAVGRDLAVTGLLALAGVGGLFWWAFGGWRWLLAAQLPILLGMAATFAAAALLFGRLSPVTTSSAALLVGLAIDFSILWLAHYGDARREMGHQGAVCAVRGRVARPLCCGALTTAVTFAALLGSGFVGLRELGSLVAIGILACLGAVLGLCEPMLRVLGIADAAPPERDRGVLRLPVLRRPPVVAACVVVLAGGVVAALQVPFEGGLSALRSPRSEAARWQESLARAFGEDPLSLWVRVDAADEGSLLERVHAVAAAVDPWRRSGAIVEVRSPLLLLPSLADQQGRRSWLASRDDGALIAAARASLVQAGLRPEAFSDALELFTKSLAPPDSLAPRRLLAGSLGPWLRGSLRGGPEGWSTLIQLAAPPDRWRGGPPPGLAAVVAGAGGVLVGLAPVSAALRERARSDLLRLAPWALALVWALLWLDLRSVRDASLVLLPVLMGLSALFLWALALGHSLTFFSLFVVVMLVGIGVDYGLHMVHAGRRGGGGQTSSRTARGVLLASATTAIGFGALLASSFPGLAAVGELAVVGAVSSAVAAVLLVPALQHRRSG